MRVFVRATHGSPLQRQGQTHRGGAHRPACNLPPRFRQSGMETRSTEREMTDAKTCPTCRSPIPPEWPDGSCPRCMLSGGLGASAPTPGAAEVEAKLPSFEIM